MSLVKAMAYMFWLSVYEHALLQVIEVETVGKIASVPGSSNEREQSGKSGLVMLIIYGIFRARLPPTIVRTGIAHALESGY